MCISLLTGICTTAFAEGDIFDAENFSSSVALATDYMSKGYSISDNGPVMQASFDYFHPSGIYAGIWGSTVSTVLMSN